MVGTVKWFNADKGFWFRRGADTGGKMSSRNVSVLQRSGVTQLAEGQRVSMGVVGIHQGLEAVPQQWSAADRTQPRIQRDVTASVEAKVTRGLRVRAMVWTGAGLRQLRRYSFPAVRRLRL